MCQSGLDNCLVLKDAEVYIGEIDGTCRVGVPLQSIYESVESKILADRTPYCAILLKSILSSVSYIRR